MIFHQHIETNNGEVWIVNASENGIIKSEVESRQEFEARVLKELIQTFIGEFELDHHSNGAPLIINRPELNVSISHSENWFALYVSEEKAVGIDIELNSSLIEKTKKHFLTQSEIERLQPNQSELQICWGIKESVYKYLQGNLQSLKNEVGIVSINQEDAKAEFQNQIIQLQFEQSEAFILVYTA